MRQGHHGEQLLKAEGKLLFSLFSLPGPACPRGAPPTAGAARVSSELPACPGARRSRCQQRGQSLHPAQAPLLPPLQTCCFAGGSSARPLLPLSPAPPVRGRGSAPSPGGVAAVAGLGCPGSEEVGGGSCCPGSEGPSADHHRLREPGRRPGTRPRGSPERRCCKLSPQKPGVEALTPSLASKPRRGWFRGGSETGPNPTWNRDRGSDGPVRSRPEQGFGGPGCAGSRNAEPFPAVGDPREQPCTPGMMGRVPGKGPRLAPLN